MRFRTTGGYERLQDATGPVGQGPDANRKENSAAGDEVRCALARQGGSVLPSHRQYQLSTDGAALHAVAARHDRAVLSGVDPDAGDRPAAFPGFHLFDFQFLSDRKSTRLNSSHT